MDKWLTHYSRLNNKQKEAVDYIDGPLLVVAGPGSGKTELLALRIANILLQTQTSPESVLCLTFTDNGAINMRERLERIIGVTAHRVAIHTFHSFASRIMDEYRENFYNALELDIAGDTDRELILDSAFRDLPHSSPLSSHHSKLGWAYYRDVKDRIRNIKMAGYNSDEYISLVNTSAEELVIVNNIFAEKWTKERMSIKNLQWLHDIIDALQIDNNLTAMAYRKELERVYQTSLDEGKTASISDWASSNIIKDDNKEVSLKELVYTEKTKDLALLYSKYEKGLYEAGLYDYDDMIINVRRALLNNIDLHNSIAEKYSYIMIDEFQDTSNAQMDMILAIANHEVNEGKPNICAVGDDDQAIYKFQGAEINNIINYRKDYWRDVKVITLDMNYRSTQDIIDTAQEVASCSKYRLTRHYSDIGKDLKSANSNLSHSDIAVRHNINKDEQYQCIANEIKSLGDSTVSVIARDHKSLKAMSKYLDIANVDYEYAYKQNALAMQPIMDIINAMQYISSLMSDKNTRDDMLIRILTAPYWQISGEQILSIASKVKRDNITWWDAISSNESACIITKTIASLMPEIVNTPILHAMHSIEMQLGIRDYYFNNDNRNNKYYTYLEGLRALYDAIGERDINNNWTLLNIDEFVMIYDKYKIPININSISSQSQVVLQTAHKSKGLEYDYVFIIDADDKIWNGSKKGNKASVPKFLYQILTGPIENEDDSVRLLYVAMTRAKHHLYISYTESKNRHLQLESKTINTSDVSTYIVTLERSLDNISHSITEQDILRSMLSDYQMSITHINNYLKVEEGGPAHYLKENLLRLPQPMNNSGAFGSAIHAAIESVFTKGISNVDDIINSFALSLYRMRIDKPEETKLYNRGVKVLNNFYNKKIQHSAGGPEYSNNEFYIEYNLAHENIQIDDAKITGKLDYVYIQDNKVHVLDWKTGKTLHSWDKGLDSNEKVKAHRYNYQLMMYRLLLENSSKFGSYDIGTLGLQFVEDDNIYALYYEHDIDAYARFKKLLISVWRAINNLEFTESTLYMPANDYETLKLEDLIKWEDELIEKYAR